MPTKIIILGASGFIGSNLFKKFSKNPKYNVKGYSSKECDLLSLNSINTALSNTTPNDVIIMASSIIRNKENSFDSMVKNILMADNISKFLKNHQVKQVIFLSTIDIYGIKPELPMNEKTAPHPDDYYSLSKLSSEFILNKICSKNNISLLILRLLGIYGPSDEGISTINKLIKSAISGKIIIYGNGEDKRDFVYVDDVYKIIEQAIPRKINATLNISIGTSYSINHIVDIIKSNFPKKFMIEHQEKDRDDERIKDMFFDNSLLKHTFPDFQFTNLAEGIKLYINNQQIN